MEWRSTLEIPEEPVGIDSVGKVNEFVALLVEEMRKSWGTNWDSDDSTCSSW